MRGLIWQEPRDGHSRSRGDVQHCGREVYSSIQEEDEWGIYSFQSQVAVLVIWRQRFAWDLPFSPIAGPTDTEQRVS